MSNIDFYTLAFGALLGLVISQFIAIWAMKTALKHMRDAMDFRRECLDAVVDIGERCMRREYQNDPVHP